MINTFTFPFSQSILTLFYISHTPNSVSLPDDILLNNTTPNVVRPLVSTEANDELMYETAFLYKKVANKVLPVATTLPDEFQIF
jgi:hypothetical protein